VHACVVVCVGGCEDIYEWVCINVYMYACKCMYIMYIRVYVYVCGVYVYGVYMYDCKGVSSCVWIHVAVISDTFVRSGPVTGDSELYSL